MHLENRQRVKRFRKVTVVGDFEFIYSSRSFYPQRFCSVYNSRPEFLVTELPLSTIVDVLNTLKTQMPLKHPLKDLPMLIIAVVHMLKDI